MDQASTGAKVAHEVEQKGTERFPTKQVPVEGHKRKPGEPEARMSQQ